MRGSMDATPTEIIIKKVRDEIKSRMGDDGIYDVVNLSFDDFDFDFSDIVFGLIGSDDLDDDKDFDVYNALMEDCELIANEEFNHIIGELKTAVGIIDGAFL
jgi:hypothetical protein